MRLLFSTTLLIEGSQVNYRVSVKPDTGRILFEPASPEVGYYFTPCFWVFAQEGQWQFLGVANEEVEHQVIQKLVTYFNTSVTTPVSKISSPQTITGSEETKILLLYQPVLVNTQL